MGVLLVTGGEPWLSFRELGLPVLHLHADTNPFNYSRYGMLASLTTVSSGMSLNDSAQAVGGVAPAVSIDQLMLLASSLGISLAATAYAIIFLRGKELSEDIAKMAVHYYPLLVQGGLAISLLAVARAREQKPN